MQPGADVITLFFYMKGRDVLTGAQVNNIVPLTYSVTGGSPLVAGQTLTLLLPQQYIAGYASGSIFIDYSVANPAGTRWSNLSGGYILNTTF